MSRCYAPARMTAQNDFERRTMVRSGAVFIFGMEEGGIKRWTEGLAWSESDRKLPRMWYRFTDRSSQQPMVPSLRPPGSSRQLLGLVLNIAALARCWHLSSRDRSHLVLDIAALIPGISPVLRVATIALLAPSCYVPRISGLLCTLMMNNVRRMKSNRPLTRVYSDQEIKYYSDNQHEQV